MATVMCLGRRRRKRVVKGSFERFVQLGQQVRDASATRKKMPNLSVFQRIRRNTDDTLVTSWTTLWSNDKLVIRIFNT